MCSSFTDDAKPGCALFGFGAGPDDALSCVASLLALAAGALDVCPDDQPRRRLMQIALGAILAGALGNMYDRVFVQTGSRFSITDRAGSVGSANIRVVDESPNASDQIVLREYPPTEEGERRVLHACRLRLEQAPEPRWATSAISSRSPTTRWWGEREMAMGLQRRGHAAGRRRKLSGRGCLTWRTCCPGELADIPSADSGRSRTSPAGEQGRPAGSVR